MALETVAELPDMRGLSRAVSAEGALVVTMSINATADPEDGALRPPDPRQNPQFTPTSLVYTLDHLPDRLLAFQHPVSLPGLTSTTPKTTATMPVATIATTSSWNNQIGQLILFHVPIILGR